MDARSRLAESRVMLLFTPELCGERDALAVLDAALPWLDAVQVRPKPPPSASGAPCPARETYDWCLRVIDVCAVRGDRRPLVLVDDRVDVAAALAGRGCHGVHVGQDDCPVTDARRFLGPGPLIGLSTHDAEQVARAHELSVDYLGFGPIHATATKGYARGLGVAACAAATRGSTLPVFAIGGIDLSNVSGLSCTGRIAVSGAILCAADPAQAARALRAALVAPEHPSPA